MSERGEMRFGFEYGYLVIAGPGSSSYRIRAWPRPNAETKVWRYGAWERFYPDFRVIDWPLPKPKPRKELPGQLELGLEPTPEAGPSTLGKKEAYDKLREQVPKSYGVALAPFKSLQWNMLLFLSFHRRYYELLRSNPFLAFSLANTHGVSGRIFRKELRLEEITGWKPGKLLELLGLEDAPRIARITAKIHPSSVTNVLPERLADMLRYDDVLKKLGHLEKINASVLLLMEQCREIRELATPGLLEEIAEDRPNNHYPLAAHMFLECVSWNAIANPNRRLSPPASLEALRGLHAGLMKELEPFNRLFPGEKARDLAKKIHLLNKRGLPPAPVPGTDTIVPIANWVALRQEGHAQHNCAWTYLDRIAMGDCFLYKVLKPERATVSLKETKRGNWEIDEVRGVANGPVSAETRKAVERWLNNARLGA